MSSMPAHNMQAQQDSSNGQDTDPHPPKDKLHVLPPTDDQSDEGRSIRALIESGPEVPESLHGMRCSADVYIDIPAGFGHYDLVDGVLEARPMADAEHQHCVMLLNNHIHEFIRSRELKFLVIQNAKAKTAVGNSNFRTPDIAVGTYDLRAVPGNSAMFPKGANPPRLVVEVTSYNRKNDLEHKVEEYLASRIPEYVIVDRDKPHNGKDAAVHVLKLRNNKYVRKCFKGNEMVECSFVENLTAAELLNPSEATLASVRNKRREKAELRQEKSRRREAEARLRQEEARRREEEARRREAEARRLEDHAKKKEYKQLLKGMGVPVSPSSNNSSRTNSPLTRSSSPVDASVKKSSSRVSSPGQKSSSAVSSPVKKRSRRGSGGGM